MIKLDADLQEKRQPHWVPDAFNPAVGRWRFPNQSELKAIYEEQERRNYDLQQGENALRELERDEER